MCVLMLFNEHKVLSWQQIKTMTGIDEETLERHVLALAHPKVKLLLKRPNRKNVTNTDKFALNEQYKNQRVRIVVGVLEPKRLSLNSHNKDTKSDKDNNETSHKATDYSHEHKTNDCNSQDVPKKLLEIRKNRVEAAIIRIMKTRKTLEHNQLVSEVVRQIQTRFQPNLQFIKQRIFCLIDRDFLKRDENDRKIYHYLP
ncbi:hypothetical protein RFI_10226 [Reticulomyxa filosa]|uniref:Cullin family profile domain-containing protein n=1 Tax=Reticulomyxa filosa TaxID=46433 RepID=X6NLQ7_RETFI|nr:hypothetical protein RFI_10226 [Reticulomyxa filosa]|eukprot:ETO26906.1 hypothetical protein RFI_10226 [Reticulomyxa filosa]